MIFCTWTQPDCEQFSWTPSFKFSAIFGHFMSAHCWMDMECPTFFWPVDFFCTYTFTIYENSVFKILAFWAIHVCSLLSGCGMSKFLLACWFSVQEPQTWLFALAVSKRGSLLGNEEHHLGGDLPIFEIIYSNLEQRSIFS